MNLALHAQTAGRIALAVTGGDGFAAFRDFDEDNHQDTPLQDILDDCSDDHEGYIALAKPGDDDPKTLPSRRRAARCSPLLNALLYNGMYHLRGVPLLANFSVATC